MGNFYEGKFKGDIRDESSDIEDPYPTCPSLPESFFEGIQQSWAASMFERSELRSRREEQEGNGVKGRLGRGRKGARPFRISPINAHTKWKRTI